MSKQEKQLISAGEESKIWKALSSLYHEFKTTNMSLFEYEEKRKEILAPIEAIETSCNDLISLRTACRTLLPGREDWVRHTVRHEGIHARIARKTAQEMEIENNRVEIRYTVYPIRSLLGKVDARATIELPNLVEAVQGSKENYIRFFDTVASHPNPSKFDRLFQPKKK